MSVRRARWLLVLTFALVVPLPMLLPFDGQVPSARYLLLTLAVAAVAATVGAAGPVPMILGLLVGHTLLGFGVALVLGWLAARATGPLAPGARRLVVLGLCAALLAGALAFEIYRTPFGTAPTANLLGALS